MNSTGATKHDSTFVIVCTVVPHYLGYWKKRVHMGEQIHTYQWVEDWVCLNIGFCNTNTSTLVVPPSPNFSICMQSCSHFQWLKLSHYMLVVKVTNPIQLYENPMLKIHWWYVQALNLKQIWSVNLALHIIHSWIWYYCIFYYTYGHSRSYDTQSFPIRSWFSWTSSAKEQLALTAAVRTANH